jgi:hypothetical protein
MIRKEVVRILIVLSASVVWDSSRLGWAQDALFVNYGGINDGRGLVEPAKESDPEAVIDTAVLGQFTPVLPITGYVLFIEWPGIVNSIPSDILVSRTGSSLQLYSDPSLPDIGALQRDGLKQLGLARIEPETGVQILSVGKEFGVANDAIKVTIDGEAVPDTERTLWLFGITLTGMVAYGRRRGIRLV